jgi:transcription antitermination factor NusA-like protein
MQATDFTVAKRIFASARGTGAIEYFVTEVLEPAIGQTPALRTDGALLDELESRGFFSRVYLNEIRELGDRLQPAMPNERIHGEVRAFAEFLYTIATKRPDEDVPLTFEGARLKLAILLVARAAVLEQYGLEAHARRIEWLIRNRFDVIYITGQGGPNASSVRMLLWKTVNAGLLTVLRTYHYLVPRYGGESNRAILAVCASNAAYLRKRQEGIRPVIEALQKDVEEIAEGRWEVVEVARKPGYGSKAAIRIQDEPDVRGAISALLARDPGLIARLRQQLGGEPVFLVPWSSDIKEFIISALTTVDPRYVSQVELDETDLEARVSVSSEQTMRAAIGKFGWCVQTASELTGWKIDVQRGGTSPEIQPIWDALNELVPELKEGTITIRAIAREPGVGSKVLLGSESGDIIPSPARVCLGDNDERFSMLKARLPGEWVFVFDWSDDVAKLIIEALYPLDPGDVVDVTIDELTLEATVLVRDSRAAKLAVGANGANVRLAEAVTNCHIQVRSEERIDEDWDQNGEGSQDGSLRAKLEECIPEIRTGEIEVVRTAYEPGIGAKIAVRYRESKLMPRRNVISVCTGLRRERARAIRDSLRGVFLTFVEWRDDIRKDLIAALYPLQEKDVRRVELDEQNLHARIEVSNEKALSEAIGSRAQNLRLAQRLTGWTIHLEKYVVDGESASPTS